MKNYSIKLKGTKKHSTQDIEVTMTCDSKSQCFNLAYQFFERAETNVIYGTKEKGLSTIHRWLHNAEDCKKYAGKYKVFMSQINIKN